MARESILDGINEDTFPRDMPYKAVFWKPEPSVEHYEAYKNIGRKFTILGSSDLAETLWTTFTGALTSGRTDKEKALVKGSNILTSGNLDVPDYVIMDFIGSVKLKDGAYNNTADKNVLRLSGKQYIVLNDPWIDGNKVNQTPYPQTSEAYRRHCIDIYNSKHVTINRPSIFNAHSYGILTEASAFGNLEDVIINDIYSYGNAHVGLGIGLYSRNVIAKGGYVTKSSDGGVVASAGSVASGSFFKISHIASEVNDGTDGFNNANCGFATEGYGQRVDLELCSAKQNAHGFVFGYAPLSEVTAKQCTAELNSQEGFQITEQANNIELNACKGINNYVYNVLIGTTGGSASYANRGIKILGGTYTLEGFSSGTIYNIRIRNPSIASQDIKIIGVDIIDTVNQSAILAERVSDLTIEGCHAWDSRGTKLQTYGAYLDDNCDQFIIIGNNFRNNLTGGIRRPTAGKTLVVDHNLGTVS